MLHVPYKGGAPAIADVIGNQVPVYFANLSEAVPHVGHNLRAYAVSGLRRVAKLTRRADGRGVGYEGFKAETGTD